MVQNHTWLMQHETLMQQSKCHLSSVCSHLCILDATVTQASLQMGTDLQRNNTEHNVTCIKVWY